MVTSCIKEITVAQLRLNYQGASGSIATYRGTPMSAYFHCPCGRRLRTSSATDGAVDCPDCGRTVVLAAVPKDRRAIWAAVIAMGVIGLAIGSSFAFRKSTPAPIVSVAPTIATPTIAPKIPQVVPVHVVVEMAPAPRTVEPTAPPVVAVLPPPMPLAS